MWHIITLHLSRLEPCTVRRWNGRLKWLPNGQLRERVKLLFHGGSCLLLLVFDLADEVELTLGLSRLVEDLLAAVRILALVGATFESLMVEDGVWALMLLIWLLLGIVPKICFTLYIHIDQTLFLWPLIDLVQGIFIGHDSALVVVLDQRLVWWDKSWLFYLAYDTILLKIKLEVVHFNIFDLILYLVRLLI